VLTHDLGEVFGAETGFLMEQDPPQMRAADVAFVPKARLKEMRADQWMPFPPALAVEVVSEYDKARDIRKKARAYMDNGTRLLWIIYPDTREVEVHQPVQPMRLLTASETLDGAEVLPGFSLPLATLFSALDSIGREADV
jgi:Uma2 family endonuclease